MAKDFLLEIGTEEIPAGYIAHGVQILASWFSESLNKEKISYEKLESFSTPRRLALRLTGVEEKQADTDSERIGPNAGAGLDENGGLSKAGMGFVKSTGMAEDSWYIKNTPKGDYLAIRVFKPGRETPAILTDVFNTLWGKFAFPKTMLWGDKTLGFARPVRWLVALWGNDVLPLEVQGLVSGRTSMGNRFQKLNNPMDIPSPDRYTEKLAQVCVVADRERRRDLIAKQLKNHGTASKQIMPDEALLDTVTDLVEYPTAGIGTFAQEYLELPEKIITSTLSQNQKYFSMKENDRLCGEFVFVANGDPAALPIIRAGNEKVIRARLEDALFYWREDKKKPLESYVDKLGEVVFQAKLGTMLEKTRRLEELVTWLAYQLKLEVDTLNKARRAALLCKADLATLMLGEKEFTKLQGYMGHHYALAAGEDAEVALALYEHYSPRGKNDALPSNGVSALVALADKMDTVCGIMGAGLIPSGSADPFALRRAAQGVVQIICERNWNLDLVAFIGKAYELLETKLDTPTENRSLVEDFFKQRVAWLLEQNNIETDVAAAVLAAGWTDALAAQARAQALQSFKKQDDFKRLALGFKRVSNILQKEQVDGEVAINLFEHEEERRLHSEYLRNSPVISRFMQYNNYASVLQNLVVLAPFIDAFFEKVLVNCPDEQRRQNRYRLLGALRGQFLTVADISLLQYEESV